MLIFYICLFLSLPHLSRCTGTSCGPRTREGFLPAGDPEAGAAAEEPTEATERLRAKKPRGNRRNACVRGHCASVSERIALLNVNAEFEVTQRNNRAGRVTCAALKMTPNTGGVAHIHSSKRCIHIVV